MDTTTAAGWALYLAPIGIIEFGEPGVIADANLYSRLLLGASVDTMFGHSSGNGSASAERTNRSSGYWGDTSTIGSTPWGSLRVRVHPMLEGENVVRLL
jgi:hypothetical protein